MFDIAVVGAGPVGLAAALEAKRQGLSCVVLERGCVADAIYRYPTYMTFFTTADLLEVGGHPFVASREKPDRKEALAYYRLVAAREGLDIRQDSEVVAVRPLPAGFALEVASKGKTLAYEARAVVIATGYYTNPLHIGVPGEDSPNASHYYTEAHPFWNRNVTIVGAGNSAADAALDLHRHGARVTLIHRGPGVKPTVKYWVKPDLENRIKEGSITAHFDTLLLEIRPDRVLAASPQGELEVPTDFTFLLTGYRPDVRVLEAAGATVDADGVVAHDSQTFAVSGVPGLYVAGSAAFGRFTNQVFIENGRVHAVAAVRDIAAKLEAVAVPA